MYVCEKWYHCCEYQFWDSEEDVTEEAKTCGHLIEVEPVVRCEDCDLWHPELKAGKGTAVCAPCEQWSSEDGCIMHTKPNDFCSYGERSQKEKE